MTLQSEITSVSVDLCRLLYQYKGDPNYTFDKIIQGVDHSAFIGLKEIHDILYVVSRGSTITQNFIDDVRAWMHYVPNIGRLHSGFYASVSEVWPLLISSINGPWVACGHSLGAGETTICTALAIKANKPPLYRVVFGEPRSGDYELTATLKDVPTLSYCNCSNDLTDIDQVTKEPPYVPYLAPYEHASTLISINNDPGPNDPWPGDIRLHHIQLYQQVLGGAIIKPC
jgi:hypothetical protein